MIGGSRVLACTPSNSSADLICERLLKVHVVNGNRILRFNAVSRDERDIPQTLKVISTMSLCVAIYADMSV